MIEDMGVKSTSSELLEKKEQNTKDEKVNFVLLKDDALIEECYRRGIDVPINENGKIIRKIAISKIAAWEDMAKPLSAARKMRVVFHRTGRQEEAPYVFLSLNGTAFQVPYEKEVSLPEPVVRGCCDDAAMTEYDFKGQDLVNGKAIYEERVVRTVPYTFLGYEA
jgi:hypothetical protein